MNRLEFAIATYVKQMPTVKKKLLNMFISQAQGKIVVVVAMAMIEKTTVVEMMGTAKQIDLLTGCKEQIKDGMMEEKKEKRMRQTEEVVTALIQENFLTTWHTVLVGRQDMLLDIIQKVKDDMMTD